LGIDIFACRPAVVTVSQLVIPVCDDGDRQRKPAQPDDSLEECLGQPWPARECGANGLHGQPSQRLAFQPLDQDPLRGHI